MAPLALLGISITGTLSFGYLKGFEGAFIYPAILALIIALVSYILVRDTPQSMGLPPIEDYRQDYPNENRETLEVELTTKEILDRKSTRLNSSHVSISYAVFCLKKKKSTV